MISGKPAIRAAAVLAPTAGVAKNSAAIRPYRDSATAIEYGAVPGPGTVYEG